MLSRLMGGMQSGGAIATIALGAVWSWFVSRARGNERRQQGGPKAMVRVGIKAEWQRVDKYLAGRMQQWNSWRASVSSLAW